MAKVLNGNPYSRKCDVYSFGICLWEIYCYDMLYPDLSFSEVTTAVVRQVLQLLEVIQFRSSDVSMKYSEVVSNAKFRILIKSGVLVGMWFELLCGLVLYKFIRIFFAEDDLIDIETSDSDAVFAVASRSQMNPYAISFF
ncbi:hypothetical protein Droror1_Dr00025642 [Drosera rotundifolia]